MTTLPASPDDTWPKAIATVTACTYQPGFGRALAFGIPTYSHFLISFNYFVDDRLHTGQFSSAKAIAQGTLFPLAYNPVAPHENEKSGAMPTSLSPVLLIGVLGSVVLSLAWLAVIRGCQ